MYDAIVIGSRCAGAPTAMLLARRGRRVLVVDRASFPARRPVRPHHPAGRHGPPGALGPARAGPGHRRPVRVGHPVRLRRRRPRGRRRCPVDGIDTAVCIRRTVLDPLLADAAAEAGAEIRSRHHGHRAGPRRRSGRRHPRPRRRRPPGRGAGVDRRRRRRRQQLRRPLRRTRPPTTCTRPATFAVYSYWRGLEPDRIELYARPGRFFVAHADQRRARRFVAQQVPVADAARYRGRTADAFAETLAEVPRLAAPRRRRRSGSSASASPDLHDSFFRQPAGPGWALVGDAGLPQGPDHRPGDARRLPRRRAARPGDRRRARRASSTRRRLRALPAGARRRGAADVRADLRAGRPRAAAERGDAGLLAGARRDQPAHIARFLGVIAGSVAGRRVLQPDSVAAVLGQVAAAAAA